MKKVLILGPIFFLLIITIALADEELFIPALGDQEMNGEMFVGDEQLGVGPALDSSTTTTPVTPSSPSGGGGGAGGGAAVPKVIFSIYPQLIQTYLPIEKDEIKTVTINNEGETQLTLELKLINLEEIVKIETTNLVIPPKQERTIELKIFNGTQKPGIYSGQLQLISKTLVKMIPILIEIESEKPLFDASIEIPKEFYEIEENSPLTSKITLINKANTGKEVNAEVTYTIKDFEGNDLYIEKESVTVLDTITYDKKLNINLKEGEYILAIKVDYGETTAVSSSTFKVLPKTIKGMQKSELYLIIGIAAILIIMLIIGILNYIKIINIKIRKPRLPVKEDLSDKLKLIKNAYKEGILKKK
ncbi:MAG: hypothetical protein PHD81_02385 [Candidatus Nanoarchaeia archaeon]|nr:hypothetical protein [Candidatus Nanoarchaeia archaeon]MDD5587934.1 hypothetical protein [Candidatus Nanoarchaeia archaeon]